MQTSFTAEQLADPDIRESEKILRTCVHCGFCTATCPTYVLLGDELDSPRGRIYLIKQMLEGGKPPSPELVKHIDRCLSCLACMTTCPSGVHYMHLVDHARAHIEANYRRPPPDRLVRRMLAFVLPEPARFRAALLGARIGRPLRKLFPAQFRSMLEMAPASLPHRSRLERPQVCKPEGQRRGRVALLTGCAQQVLAPQINEATVRLLTRMGLEVVIPKGQGCCGALTHHLGMAPSAHAYAGRNIRAWVKELEGGGLDAVVINASGCGTMVKDYGFMFREDPALAEPAARISQLALDVTEAIERFGPTPATRDVDLVVAYHSACSMQHGQRITTLPKRLLADAGFTVKDVPEGHICCGSAGTYNLLQPEIAGQLQTRKAANIELTRAQVVAAGNIGCITQIAPAVSMPVLHTVELLDWATGGPRPAALDRATPTAG
jgi:glycolate oxidase iron-sulfur subunit